MGGSVDWPMSIEAMTADAAGPSLKSSFMTTIDNWKQMIQSNWGLCMSADMVVGLGRERDELGGAGDSLKVIYRDKEPVWNPWPAGLHKMGKAAEPRRSPEILVVQPFC